MFFLTPRSWFSSQTSINSGNKPFLVLELVLFGVDEKEERKDFGKISVRLQEISDERINSDSLIREFQLTKDGGERGKLKLTTGLRRNKKVI